MRELPLRDVKAHLSVVIDDVVQGEPVIISRHSKPQAVILSFAEWERLSRVPTFGRLLMAAPVQEGDLPERNASPLRPTEF
jgi:prevent-host-death family protein